MKLSEVKHALTQTDKLIIRQPDGQIVPTHFHITEVGQVHKHFIDCGGTIRTERRISFQLFTADDYDHRLSAEKLRNIIQLSEDKLDLPDEEIEVEYQRDSIGKFGLTFDGEYFHLTTLHTDCLAKEQCGIPVTKKKKVRLSDLQASSCCDPSDNCC